MFKKSFIFIVLVVSLAVAVIASAQTPDVESEGVIASLAPTPLSTAFTYQGYLLEENPVTGRTPLNGHYELRFRLFDEIENGGQVGSDLILTPVRVQEGVFTVELDFGGEVFDGNERYLQIGFRPLDSADPFEEFAPRFHITAQPYALHALRARQLDVDPDEGLEIGVDVNAVGLATAIGFEATATGGGSVAMGLSSQAEGFSSTAIGNFVYAADDSTAIGQSASAEDYSIAIGQSVFAEDESVAIGNFNFANGFGSIAIGMENHASGESSTAMGYFVEASGGASTAMGYSAEATGELSTAIGPGSLASGDSSTAMGPLTFATGGSSTAIGHNVQAVGNDSTAIGRYVQATGDSSTAMGVATVASGEYSTVMGFRTEAASYASTALGRYNLVAGDPTTWVDTDPLLVIGNGTDNANRSNAMTVLKNGRVGIGTADPQDTLHVDGTALAEAWNTPSDQRLKTDVMPIEEALALVSQLEGVRFTWQESGERSIGVIAQQVEEIVPEIVNTRPDGLKSVDYDKFTALLIEAVKQQQTTINEQNATIEQLQEQMTQLEALVQQLLEQQPSDQSERAQ